MKRPATKRDHTRPRRKPPSEADVQFVISALASFGARADLVPTDNDPPESWERWRRARARQAAVPVRLLDHAAALLDCVPPDRGPPGAKADPAIAEALRIAALFGMAKIDAARHVVRLRAWRERCAKADRRAKERAEARRKEREQSAVQEDIPEGIKGELEVWRVQSDERSFLVEERLKGYDAHCEPEAVDALEAEAKRLARAMEPSRRRSAKLRR
jgi:hypothetical protein